MSPAIEKKLKKIYTEFDAIGRVEGHAFAIKSESQGFKIYGYFRDEQELSTILYKLQKRWRAHYALELKDSGEL